VQVTELKVTEVFENSYAAALGIKVDDVLRFLNGMKLFSIEQLITYIENNEGNPATYEIQRGDSKIYVKGKALDLGLKINDNTVVTRARQFDVSELSDNENSTSGASSSSSIKPSSVETSLEYAFLSLLLFFIAILGLIGGLVVGVEFWPSGYGYDDALKHARQIYAITFIFAGVIQFALFAALGQGLHYLRQIASNKYA
jgi:hypothetical protein